MKILLIALMLFTIISSSFASEVFSQRTVELVLEEVIQKEIKIIDSDIAKLKLNYLEYGEKGGFFAAVPRFFGANINELKAYFENEYGQFTLICEANIDLSRELIAEQQYELEVWIGLCTLKNDKNGKEQKVRFQSGKKLNLDKGDRGSALYKNLIIYKLPFNH